MSGDHHAHTDSARGSFERAVARERAAIELHERAIALHEDAARRLTSLADIAQYEAERTELLQRATVETDRAEEARRRARDARQRLIDEGEATGD